MTPIGHSLTGVAIGVGYCCWSGRSLRSNTPLLTALVLCANLPDLPLPGWGHHRYHVSHSIISGIVLSFAIAAGFAVLRRSMDLPWQLLAVCLVALFSHYFLDSLYNHGKGVAVLWPLSSARLVLPLPWLSTMQIPPLFSLHNITVWGVETVCFGALIPLAAWCGRRAKKGPT